jgi:hypothetical protein
MAEFVLGPSVFVVVLIPSKQYRTPILIANKKRVTLGGDRETVDVAPSSRLGT